MNMNQLLDISTLRTLGIKEPPKELYCESCGEKLNTPSIKLTFVTYDGDTGKPNYWAEAKYECPKKDSTRTLHYEVSSWFEGNNIR
jgi:hypothetical protein